MTGTLLPIIAGLAECKTHVERAEWLLACPIHILRKYAFTIRNRLSIASCVGGLSYLEELSTVLHSTRDDGTGMFSRAAEETFFGSGQRLLTWAANRDAYEQYDPADYAPSDPTEL